MTRSIGRFSLLQAVVLLSFAALTTVCDAQATGRLVAGVGGQASAVSSDSSSVVFNLQLSFSQATNSTPTAAVVLTQTAFRSGEWVTVTGTAPLTISSFRIAEDLSSASLVAFATVPTNDPSVNPKVYVNLVWTATSPAESVLGTDSLLQAGNQISQTLKGSLRQASLSGGIYVNSGAIPLVANASLWNTTNTWTSTGTLLTPAADLSSHLELTQAVSMASGTASCPYWTGYWTWVPASVNPPVAGYWYWTWVWITCGGGFTPS
jgi:hypothetical protein